MMNTALVVIMRTIIVKYKTLMIMSKTVRMTNINGFREDVALKNGTITLMVKQMAALHFTSALNEVVAEKVRH